MLIMLGLIALAERNTGVADGTRMSYSVIKPAQSIDYMITGT